MSENDVGHKIMKISSQLKRAMNMSPQMRTADKITAENGRILLFLYENRDKPLYQRDIEEYFSLTRPTVSRVLKLMERKRLVERKSVDNDARLKRISITEKGMDIVKLCEDARIKNDKKLLSGFSDEEIKALDALLQRAIDNLNLKQA